LRERGKNIRRGATPLLDTPYDICLLKGEEGEILERGETPLSPTLPLPLLREGGQGDRLLNNLPKR